MEVSSQVLPDGLGIADDYSAPLVQPTVGPAARLWSMRHQSVISLTP